MMHTIRTILESRDFITAALQIIGLLTLAGFWLLYFVRYHRTRRKLERAHKCGTYARSAFAPTPPQYPDHLRCQSCGAFPWRPRA